MNLRDTKQFRPITPAEYVQEGTLIWIESFRNAYYDVEVQGPFMVIDGRGPSWFGSPNQNNPRSNSFVMLYSADTGDNRKITWGSFLNESFFVMLEETCIDVETK